MIHIGDDAWLGEVMARPVFRLTGDLAAEGDARALAEHVRAQARAFYFAKVDTAKITTVRPLAAAGFVVVDTNVVFELDRRSELANAIKREWCRNYARKRRGDHLFVARVDGQPAGFLAALTTPTSAVIDRCSPVRRRDERRSGSATTAESKAMPAIEPRPNSAM